jgi:MFS family permease
MAVNGFLSIYLVSIGASASLVGGAWALGAVVEIPLMLAFPALAARFGIGRLVVVGGALLLARTALLLATNDPYVAAASMALHGAGFALLLVGGITYVARHAPPRAGATAQGVLAGVVVGLAQAIGPGLSGVIAGSAGIETAFTVALALSAVGLVALVVAVRLGRPPRATTE